MLDFLKNINSKVEVFLKEPNAITKDSFLRDLKLYDLNNLDCSFRIESFSIEESNIIETLYAHSININCNSLKLFVYRYIYIRLYSVKLSESFTNISHTTEGVIFKNFMNLNLFYYIIINVLNIRDLSFFDILCDIYDKNKDYTMLKGCIILLYDLSFNEACFIDFQISTEELISIYSKIIADLKKYNYRITDKNTNFLNMIATPFTNYILKKRKKLNDCIIYKTIGKYAISNNKQLWIRNYKYMNDPNEGEEYNRALLDFKLNSKFNWLKYIEYNKDEDFLTFSTCFNVIMPSDDLIQEYGGTCLAYNVNNIQDRLAPIFYRGENKSPIFSKVLSFDILYDIDEAKNEIEYIASNVNSIFDTDDEKVLFMNHILPYFKYSTKVNKYQKENERRYFIFLFKGYDYESIQIDDEFAKFDNVVLSEYEKIVKDTNL